MRKAIGIDVGGTNLKSGILLESSGKLNHLEYSPSEAQKGPKQVIDNIKRSIERLLKKEQPLQFAGIGIGVPGQVDYVNGIVYDPPNFPGWRNEPLAETIKNHFQIPTFIDNDGNVAALAESEMGAGKHSKYFALITLGTGVGCGLILDNKIYHGARGAAGEFGHMTIKYDGPVCKCGQQGCIERFVGAQGIVERTLNRVADYPDSMLHQLSSNQEVSPKIVAQFAQEGDALCKLVIEETGKFLGVALASLVNLLNLDLILLGGGISKAGSILMDATRKSVKTCSLSQTGSIVKVATARLGEKAGIVGAGQLVFDHLANR